VQFFLPLLTFSSHQNGFNLTIFYQQFCAAASSAGDNADAASRQWRRGHSVCAKPIGLTLKSMLWGDKIGGNQSILTEKVALIHCMKAL
jgi:hypothetical protein